MTDERPTAQEAIWNQLRAIEPPAGAKRRVLDALDGRIRRRPRRWLYLAALPAVAIALVLVLRTRGSQGPLVSAATMSQQGDRVLTAGARLGEGEIRVDGVLHVELARARVSVVGPANVRMDNDHVMLSSGRFDADGELDVSGPSCRAHVRGKASVEVKASHTLVTIFAGSVEIVRPELSCELLDLTKPVVTAEVPRPAPPPPPAPEPPPAPREIVPERPPPHHGEPPQSVLAQQTAAYWHAQELRKTDPQRALESLQAFAHKWPKAAIRHEVDLATIDLLVELGRTTEARTAARRFLKNFPRSERAVEVRAIAGTEP